MGCGLSAEQREMQRKTQQIDDELKKEQKEMKNDIKMLLLGTVLLERVSPLRAEFLA